MNSEKISLKFPTLFLGTALGLVACGGGNIKGPVAPVEPGTVRVVADDSQDFAQDRYEAVAGQVRIEYVLDGFQAHTLVVEGYEEQMRLEVANGETEVGTLSLTAGGYILYCDISGHREAGMEAQLLVE
ncbi:MAG: sulfocyanin-like copper-binding protein [Acidimicrobiales bacterium]|jgi:uncharacterized cupredoxin-like copper-binding protein